MHLSPTPLHPLIPKPPPIPLGLTVVSAKSQPQPDQDVGGSGRSILTKLKSNPKPASFIAVPQKKQKQDEVSRQISGSEVLFAMQKAAAKKSKESRKKKTNTRGGPEVLSSVGRYREEEEEDDVDYSKVRPLSVKSDWGTRLDELEMRLQELSSKTI